MSSSRQALINKLVVRRTDLLPLLILDERVSNRIYANQLVRQLRVLFSSFSRSPRSRAGSESEGETDRENENLNQKLINHALLNESAILIRHLPLIVISFRWTNLVLPTSPMRMRLEREWESTKKKHQGCQLGVASAGSGRQLFFLFALFSSQQDDDRILVCLQGTTRVLSIWMTCSSISLELTRLSLFSCLTRCWLWILPLLIHLNRWPLSPSKISTKTTTTKPTTNIVTVKWQRSIEHNIIKAAIAKLARSAEEVSLTMNRICRIRWEPIWSSTIFHKPWLKMKSKISSVQLVLLNLANLFAIKQQVKRSRESLCISSKTDLEWNWLISLSGQSLGYGFVNFIRTEDAEKAVKTMNGLRLQNKTIKVNYPRAELLRRVSWLSSNPTRETEHMPHLRKTLFLQVSFARPSSDSIKFANLYICGIPKQWTSKELEGYFTSCGKIITSRILLDSSTGSIRRRSHLTPFCRQTTCESWPRALRLHVHWPAASPHLSLLDCHIIFRIISFDIICFSFRFLLRVPLRIQSNFPIFIFQISHGRWLSRSSRLCLPSLVVLFRRRFFAIPKQVDPFVCHRYHLPFSAPRD